MTRPTQQYPGPQAPGPQAPPVAYAAPGYPVPPQRPARSPGDARLVAAGVACAALSVAGIVLHASGVVTPTVAGLFVILPVAVGLQVVLRWAARSASAARRAQVLNLVSWVGLGVSLVTIIAMLPHLTRAGGSDKFVSSLFANAWPILLLTLGAGAVRTMTWRPLLGAGLAGFLAIPALGRMVGDPAVERYGTRIRVVGGWIPLTEELLKALPIVLVVWLAARRKDARPSAADIVLLGMWVGAGYGVYEDALFGRGDADFSAAPVLSLLLPVMVKVPGSDTAAGVTFLSSGHLVFTAVFALGLAVTVLYRRRFRLAWLAAPVGLALAIGVHGAGNALLALQEKPPAIVSVPVHLMLNGYLAPLLLIGGTAALVVFEWRRATRKPRQAPVGMSQHQPGRPGISGIPGWLLVTRRESARRAHRLAYLQLSQQVTTPAGYTRQQVGGMS